jgi:uncharacterized membrane protein YqiK
MRSARPKKSFRGSRGSATGEADAVRIRALADEERYRVEAEGKRSINEARNALSEEQIQLEIKLELLRQLPQIIEQSVKPMENIDGIKIIDVRGMGGVGGGDSGGGHGSGGDGNLARSVVDHALRYRAQRPLVDALLKEVGLENLSDLSGLAKLTQATEGAEAVKASDPPTDPR